MIWLGSLYMQTCSNNLIVHIEILPQKYYTVSVCLKIILTMQCFMDIASPTMNCLILYDLMMNYSKADYS